LIFEILPLALRHEICNKVIIKACVKPQTCR